MAASDYKYRVKLVPGTQKKGKTGKAAVDVFSTHPDVTNQEKELIKAISDNEMTQVLLSGVKIGAAAGSKGEGGKKKKLKGGKSKGGRGSWYSAF